MSSRVEKLLTALLNGYVVNDVPLSRIEQALLNCVMGSGKEGLSDPSSTSEELIHQLAEKLKGGIVGEQDYKEFIERTAVLPALPPDLTSIGNYAFHSFTNLALTSLPDGVTSIGNYAFSDCTNLALTSLPDGVTTIGNNAFYRCPNLALKSMPASLTSIGIEAFAGCTNLALISLPAGVTTISDYAFQGCTNLTEVRFEGTPSSISSIVFGNNLISIKVPWAEGAVANAPWGATNATITYN